MFLADFSAEFNKNLNAKVRAFTRIIKGKAIPVKGHSRKYVMGVRTGLKDLQKRGAKSFEEGSYLINKHGMVSNFTPGGYNTVQPLDVIPHIYKNSRYTKSSVLPGMIDKVYSKPFNILHNHTGTSSLSTMDINAATKNNQVYAINENGSIFRGYKLKDVDMKKANSELFAIASEMSNRYKDAKITDIRFLASHIRNKRLHNRNEIFYRSKLSQSDKKTIDKYSSFMNEMLNSEDVKTPDKMTRVGKFKIDVLYGKKSQVNPRFQRNNMPLLVKRLQIGNLTKKQKETFIKSFDSSSDRDGLLKIVKTLKSNGILRKDDDLFS